MCNNCSKSNDSLSKEDQDEVDKIKDKIHEIQNKNLAEYEALSKESEKLHDAMEELGKKYSVLDEKTGLNKLFVELEKYYPRNCC